jgi:predicted nucleotidyltransferase
LARESSEAYTIPPDRGLANLQPNERVAIRSFVVRLRAQFGERITLAMLFGSKARGDGDPDSDIDILIVADTDDWQFEQQVYDVASIVDQEYDVLLNPHLLSQKRWQDIARRRAALWLNVQRDGLQLSEIYNPSS